MKIQQQGENIIRTESVNTKQAKSFRSQNVQVIKLFLNLCVRCNILVTTNLKLQKRGIVLQIL